MNQSMCLFKNKGEFIETSSTATNEASEIDEFKACYEGARLRQLRLGDITGLNAEKAAPLKFSTLLSPTKSHQATSEIAS